MVTAWVIRASVNSASVISGLSALLALSTAALNLASGLAPPGARLLSTAVTDMVMLLYWGWGESRGFGAHLGTAKHPHAVLARHDRRVGLGLQVIHMLLDQ